MKRNYRQILVLIGILFFAISCQKEDSNLLTVTPTTVEFAKEGGSEDVRIETDADSWHIENSASDWISLSNTGGTNRISTLTLTIKTKTITAREATLVITAGNAKPVNLLVKQASSEYLYSLSSDISSLSYAKAGSSSAINISTDAAQWKISADADWVQFSKTSGASGKTAISVTTQANSGTDARTAKITLSADYAPNVEISVWQKGDAYPSYNVSPKAADASGMSSTAKELAAKIKLGWNIGNTMEASGSETAWGNPRVSKELIDLVKASGFNAIRIPCDWNQYMTNSLTAEIKADWLARVKEVVQYCVDDNMYVILNIHWDGGWLEENCTEAKKDENNAKQKAFWEQIATTMRDFDEHLLFASANEPNVANATEMAVLNSYHQTFIDAVRSTGGKNAYRVLVVQGPSTDIEKTNKLMTSLPTDKVNNRMMVEIHYYTPWNFTGMTKDESWGKMAYYWGNGFHSTTDTDHNSTWGEEASVDSYFAMMKQQFVDKDIPVVIGEFGAVRRDNLTGDALKLHLASRAYFLKYVTKQAIANGMLPFYWDSGGLNNLASGIFDRLNNKVYDQQALTALIEGATK